MGRRFGVALLAAAAVTAAAAGCGRASSAVGHTVPSIPVVTSTASSSPASITTAPPTSAPAASAPAATTASSTAPAVAANPAGANTSASSDLAAIQSDEQSVDAGTNQSDTDYAAGTSAQSQPDQP